MTGQVAETAPDEDEAVASTRDSLVVAVWTAISRCSGLVRVAVIAAVLGPTFLGNTYQFTNSVPNLVYYGLLGGSLVSSLLVPALVRHLAAQRKDEAISVARGLFGCAAGAALVAVPLIMVVVPFVLQGTTGGTGAVARAQLRVASWLVVLLAPQIVCYAVIACSVAVMSAHRRFALAAAAPTIENVGSIVVLAIVWLRYGTGREVTDVTGGEIAVLGIGSTLAVAVHAAVQWWGARRAGIALRPRRGWRDAEVRTVAARSGLAVAQAGLWAVQMIIALALANRVPGGVVALLIATNFFFLPIALGAAPIALSTLPRLAAHHSAGRADGFADALARAISLTLFVVTPAAVGYLLLAPRLARVVTFGSVANDQARDLVTLSLAALALGVIGTAVFTVATYASYARDDAITPLTSMGLQALVAVPVMAASLAVHGNRTLLLIAGGLALGGLTGAVVQLRRLNLPAAELRRLAGAVGRALLGVLAMAPAVWTCDHVIADGHPSRTGQITALALAVLAGALVYVLAQRLLRSPELALLRAGATGRRYRPAHAVSTRAVSS